MSEARIHRLFLNSPRWSIPIPEGRNSVRVTFSQTGLELFPSVTCTELQTITHLPVLPVTPTSGSLPTLFPFLVARQLPNPRAGYEEQSRTALDHVANLSPFNRRTTALPPFMPTEIGIS